MIRSTVLAFGIGFCAVSSAVGQSASMSTMPSGKFRIDDTLLHYDTENAAGNAPAEIVGDDVDKLLSLLTQNPQIDTIVLNSAGGWVWAGEEMSRIVTDFELDTHVNGECSSSCVTIFLGGQTRTMARGSKIGFHQTTWSAAGMQSYYKRWYGDEDGWDNPFDFSAWVYHDVQSDTYEQLSYMVDRGVDAAFAIETKRAVSDLWFPSRHELERAGVLRD